MHENLGNLGEFVNVSIRWCDFSSAGESHVQRDVKALCTQMMYYDIKQEPEENFECLKCGKVFTDYKDIEKHQEEHFSDGNHAANNVIADSNIKTELSFYECPVCEDVFERFEDCEKHHQSHLSDDLFETESLTDSSENEELTAILEKKMTNQLKVKKERFGCKICGKAFAQRCHLYRHERNHSNDRPHSCSECGKSFSRKGVLKRHLLSHSGERQYVCEICKKGFKQSQHLIKHARTHSGEKPFVCKVCNKSFGQQITLDRHQSTHTMEKPFACDKCDKRFGRIGSLQRHQIIHTGLRPFVCKFCNKTFNRSCYLLKHERNHDNTT